MMIKSSHFIAHKLFTLVFFLLFIYVASCQTKKQPPIVDTINFTYGAPDDNFVGPFASWSNIKTDFGAIGDGVADDTKAIQKALDFLHYNSKRVLYFPAGTYRITQTLTLSYILHIAIIGEDPANTIIKWDGVTGGVMIDLNGVSYSHYGRLTWEGAGKAATAVVHAWDGKKSPANTDGEHADEVFKNLQFGIRAGGKKKMDAECVIKRCHFENCKEAGISIENFNAADWEVWYSTFKHCGYGVTTMYGAGYFNVYYSCFIGSTRADMAKYHCGFFAARYNTSINSAKFFFSQNHNCPGLVSIQGNKIYYATDSHPIDLNDVGPNMLLDNTIICRDQYKKEANAFVYTPETGLSVGNQYSSNPPFTTKTGILTSIQDNNIPSEKASILMPTLPSTASLFTKGVIIDIPVGVNETVIQKILDSAIKKTNKEIVFHFPAGNYYIANTIVLPPNRKIQLIGDGFDSKIIWSPMRKGAMFLLQGPSLATLKELQLDGKGKAIGIEISNCDQEGSRVFMDQANAKGSVKAGLLYDSLDHTQALLRNFYHEGCKETSVMAIGGNKKTKGIKTEGAVSIYCGASSNSNYSYDVRNNADLLVNDIWYEASTPGFMRLTDSSSGNITLNGGVIATGRAPLINGMPDSNYYPIVVDGFKGNLTLLNENIYSKILVTDKNKEANNVMGILLDGRGNYFTQTNPNASNIAFWGSCRQDNTGGAAPIPAQTKPTDAFILKMLQQQRTQLPKPLLPVKPNTTDVRIYRVNVVGAYISFHLKP